jgi:hypothetical protein
MDQPSLRAWPTWYGIQVDELHAADLVGVGFERVLQHHARPEKLFALVIRDHEVDTSAVLHEHDGRVECLLAIEHGAEVVVGRRG